MRSLLNIALLSVLMLWQSQNPNQNNYGADAQQYPLLFTSAPAGSCGIWETAVNTANGDYYDCANGSWNKVNGGGSASLPAGMIAFLNTGSCPTGFAEVASTGNYILLTTAVAGGVGTSGGSNAYTPGGTVSQPSFNGSAGTVPAQTFTGSAGTVPAQVFTGSAGTVPAQTFTGSAGTVPAQVFTGSAGTVPAEVFTGTALATHQHEEPFQDPSASGTTNFRGIAPATFGTGTSRAAVWGITTTSVTTSAAVALSQAVSAGTPAGTNGTASFTPAGTNGTASFTPAGTNGTASFTPAGTNGTASFTPAGTNGTASFTPAGTVTQPGFSGNAATLTPTYLKLIPCQKT